MLSVNFQSDWKWMLWTKEMVWGLSSIWVLDVYEYTRYPDPILQQPYVLLNDELSKNCFPGYAKLPAYTLGVWHISGSPCYTVGQYGGVWRQWAFPGINGDTERWSFFGPSFSALSPNVSWRNSNEYWIMPRALWQAWLRLSTRVAMRLSRHEWLRCVFNSNHEWCRHHLNLMGALNSSDKIVYTSHEDIYIYIYIYTYYSWRMTPMRLQQQLSSRWCHHLILIGTPNSSDKIVYIPHENLYICILFMKENIWI